MCSELKNSAFISDKLKHPLIRAKQIFKSLPIFSLALLCFFSHAAPDIQLLDKLDIQRALFSDHYETFDIDNQQVIYVLQENTTAMTKGVAVMIGESGTPVIGQRGLAPLATQLNKIGWVTLLLPAPQIAFTAPQPDTNSEQPESNTEQSGETVTEEPVPEETAQASVEYQQAAEKISDIDLNTSSVSQLNANTFEQHEQQLLALLQASFGKAEEYPGFFLVIAQGTSAAWLTKVYAEKKIDIPDAFVAISPFWPDRKLNQMLPALTANTPMPLLDLYTTNDNEWAKKTAQQREISAVKGLKLHYRQRQLLGYNVPKQNGLYLSKEIYGWLTYMGW